MKISLFPETINSLPSASPLTSATNFFQTSAIPLSTISRTTTATTTHDRATSTIPSQFTSSSSLTAAASSSSSSSSTSSSSSSSSSSSLSPLEPSFKSQMNQIQNELYHRSPLYTPVTLLGQYRNHNKDKIEDTGSLSSGSNNDVGSEYIKNLEDFQIHQQKLGLLQQQQKNVSSSETNVTVQIGNHAYLPCNVSIHTRSFCFYTERVFCGGFSCFWLRLFDQHNIQSLLLPCHFVN